jgi:hypothetical protein
MSNPYDSDAYNLARPAADNPFGITKDMMTSLTSQITEYRRKAKLAGKRTTEATEALFKIPQYDWKEDPRGYKSEESAMQKRCIHCGQKFVHIKQWDAFCGPCHIAMLVGGEDYLLGWLGKDKIRSKIRIPDGVDESVFRKQLKDGTEVKFTTGVNA